MITGEQINEIRELLNASERPLFLYDDDPDGLCSFILLRKFIGLGKGVVVKCSPKLSMEFLRKINEYNPDRVFILDKPIVPQEFVESAKVPLVWIDHHEPAQVKGVRYFNPMINDSKDNRPTSYWCYKVTQQDLWIAMCGIVGDWMLPEFTNEFVKQYPGLLENVNDPGEALYSSPFGELVKIMSFMLKSDTATIAKCANILLKINSPYEILRQETPAGKFLYREYEKVNRKYQPLLKDALSYAKRGKILVYTYPSSVHSFTGDLSNELLYRFPEKVIIVARQKNDEMRMSIRSNEYSLPPIIKKALEGVQGYGGGHEHACGASVKDSDFTRFVENLKKELKNSKP